MAKPPPQKKIPQFAYTREASLHTYRFPDAPIPDVSMTIEDPEYDKFHRLYATVTSRIGADEIAPSRIDLLNLQHRVDYEHVAAELDGKVPWHNLLLVIVSHLRKQLGSHKEKQSPVASPKKTTRQRSEASPPIPQTTIGDTGLPQIVLTTEVPLRDLIHSALGHWVDANEPPQTFVRGGAMARVRPDEHGRPIIDELLQDHVRGALMRCADFGWWEEIKEDEWEFRHKPPPLDIVRDILQQGRWPFPPLEGVVETPIVRPDGSLLTDPGYDRATNLYYQPSPDLELYPIPDHPTEADRGLAKAVITEAIGDFPYADDASRANAWAAMFTPIIRHVITGCAPLALIDKPQMGTGASLFTKILTMISTGRTAGMTTAPKDDEEWRKKITSLLEQGATVIIIDNIEHPLWAPSLAAALTTSLWEDRELGRNKILRLPQRATWLATGNNIKLRGDLPRRCYWIRMDAHTARPWERTEFTHKNLETWVSEHRGHLLTALLTIVRAWYADGQPRADVPTMGSFESWAITVGSILAHAGIHGFLQNREALYEQLDEESPQWEGFLTSWREIWTTQEMTVATIIKAFQLTDCAVRDCLPHELMAALPAKDGAAWNGFATKLGRAFSRKAGAQYGEGGLHLKKSGKDQHTKNTLWKVCLKGEQ